MMARAPVLFFGLEFPDAIVYKCSTAFVDFNFTFLFINMLARELMNKQKSKIEINLAALANEGLAQIQADSYVGIEIRRLWVEL